MTTHDMPTFNALSASDKWRINRYLKKGEAPKESRMAAAAVKLAEYYQDAHGPSYWKLVRWFVLAVAAVCGVAAIGFAVAGDVLIATATAIAAVPNIVALAVSPIFSPKDVARSLEASRAFVKSDG